MKNITITGVYKGNDLSGTMIGGKVFKKNNVLETNVEENVFLKLVAAKENGWFDLRTHNLQNIF
jgi:hypothetical protein